MRTLRNRSRAESTPGRLALFHAAFRDLLPIDPAGPGPASVTSASDHCPERSWLGLPLRLGLSAAARMAGQCEGRDSSRRYGRVLQRSRCGCSGETQ